MKKLTDYDFEMDMDELTDLIDEAVNKSKKGEGIDFEDIVDSGEFPKRINKTTFKDLLAYHKIDCYLKKETECVNQSERMNKKIKRTTNTDDVEDRKKNYTSH